MKQSLHVSQKHPAPPARRKLVPPPGPPADAFPRTPGVRYGFIWWPPVEINVDEEKYVFAADVSGADPGDIDIEVMENEIVVSGKDAGASFAFAIALPEPVDEADVEAELDRGVLRVTAPRSAATRWQQRRWPRQRPGIALRDRGLSQREESR